MKLLFADDEPSLQELMRLELPRMGHEVTVCPDGSTALAALDRNIYDCLLVDLDMPGASGLEVIAQAKRFSAQTDAVVLTGKSSLETAVAALRFGAFDYLTKPCKLIEVDNVLRRVAEKRVAAADEPRRTHETSHGSKQSLLVGTSPAMDGVRKLIDKVAPTNCTILILGETGTGKELVARSVHEKSLRADKQLIPVNCGALPENLIESELFGHRKGSFTGADEHRTGLFQAADGGTLFLDEIGELPKATQAKLLRFLESGEIRRVGENESVVCNVRVICATNRRLDEMVAAGEFREDLWFRINTFEISIPPLRSRTADILPLARHLAQRSGWKIGASDEIFSAAAAAALAKHGWSGNVRELANVVEHALILCDKPPIELEHLPSRFLSASHGQTATTHAAFRPGACSLRAIEFHAIHEALDRHSGNKARAAEELGISLKTLYNKLSQAATSEKTA
jgi:two-component system NtrC family response regulator